MLTTRLRAGNWSPLMRSIVIIAKADVFTEPKAMKTKHDWMEEARLWRDATYPVLNVLFSIEMARRAPFLWSFDFVSGTLAT